MAYAHVLLTDSTRKYDHNYTYRFDEQLWDLQPGHVVKVPFGPANRRMQAVVTEIVKDTDDLTDIEYKEILDLVKPEPVYNREQLKLALEMRRRYFCSTGQALRTIAPAAVLAVKSKSERYARLNDPAMVSEMLAEGAFRSLNQIRVLEMLLSYECCSLQEISNSCSVNTNVITRLAKNGYIEIFRRPVKRLMTQAMPWREAEVKELTKDQKTVIDRVLADFNRGVQSEFLLQGVTGSGKTEVYLQLAEQVLQAGREVIILVPEISLTPLMTGRIVNRFGDGAAILHSRLTATERYEQWNSIASGHKKLVVGARSAVFAPLANVGLIIIDEEQEDCYISDLSPRYDAAEIARLRSHFNQSILLLGSATPKVTTRHRCEAGKSILLELPERVHGRCMPEVNIIECNGLNLRSNIFSDPLLEALQAAFARGEQAILFHNRRGRSQVTYCQHCGKSILCENCDVALKQHNNQHNKGQKMLICHYCGSVSPIPKQCPYCGSAELLENGAGTQAIESEFIRLFPERKILRMDKDTTTGRGDHATILRAFADGEADCLLGTQMIAKGHDFPSVTVVGITSADDLLIGQSYRAAEKGFQLITQAAGRSGRAEQRGRVYVQTRDRHNYALKYAVDQDYIGFYGAELERRRVFDYPPFTNLGVIMLVGSQREEVVSSSLSLAEWLDKTIERNQLAIKNFGAAEAPLNRLNKRWRQRIVLKAEKIAELNWLLSQVIDLPRRGDYYLTCQINDDCL